VLEGTGLFEYFPGNYSWSSAVNLALMAGGSLGDMHRFLHRLRETGETDRVQWAAAWAAMGHQQEALAEDDIKAGHLVTAGSRYLRASVYHASGQRQLPPGPEKSEHYAAALQAFNNAREHMPLPLLRIHVDSPDGTLPGYLIAPSAEEPGPVVIFYGGLDLSKEMLYAIVGHTLARRGITCLVMDTPGVGEPLRLRGVPSRPDYEVPTAAIIDHLETRNDLDASRVAVMGISLGGYYAARAAAFEPRVGACVAWSGIWDWGATMQNRWDSRSERAAVPWFQLPWVMGTTTLEAALERARQWSLVDVWPQVQQPLLIVHGEHDQQIPVEDAARAYAAAGSADKYLRVFSLAEGGAEHIQTDEPDPARQLIADWLAHRLGAVPANPSGLLAAL
jgi:dienelactone hydrolase